MIKDPSPRHKAMRGRNFALLAVLLGLALLVAFISFVKIGGMGA